MYTIGPDIRFEFTRAGSGMVMSVEDAKEHLRVDIDTEDDYIALLIGAAQAYTENFTGRPYTGIEVVQYFDTFPYPSAVLYWGDVTAVTAVKYLDADAQEQTFSGYYVDKVMDRARIVIDRGSVIPQIADRPNAVWVEYDAGKAPPADVLQAMKWLVAEMYEKRENAVKQLPTAAEWILAMHRLWQI